MKTKLIQRLENIFIIILAISILFLLLCLMALMITAISKVVSEIVITMLFIVSIGIIAKAYLYERTKK